MSQIPTDTTTGTTPDYGAQAAPNSPIVSAGHPLNADNVVAAANAAPKLDPTSTLGLAQVSANPAEAAANAYMAQAYTRASIQADVLKGLGVDFQDHYWKTATASEQALLAATGYKPPTADQVAPSGTGGGFWHAIVHGLDMVRHAGSWVAAHSVKPLVEAPGKAFSAAWSPVDRLMRAGFLNSQQAGLNAAQHDGGNEWTPGSILQTLDPLAIIHAWGEVGDGATTYQPETLQYVTKILGLDKAQLALAKTMASGASLQQVLKSVASGQRGQAFALTQDATFQQAVKLLSDSHLTPGQMVFGGLSPEQYKQMFPHANTGELEATSLGAQAASVAGAAATVATDPEEGLAFTSGVRGALGRAILAGGAGGMAQGVLKGETPDVATRVAPFGMQVNPMSGLLDSVASWYMNPLFQGMEGASAYKSGAYGLAAMDGMGAARDIPAFYRNTSAGQWAARKIVQLATEEAPSAFGGVDGVDRPNIAALNSGGFQVEGAGLDLVKKFWPEIKAASESKDPTAAYDVVGRMVADGKGLTDFLRGRGARMFRDETVLPHMTLGQRIAEQVKGIGQGAYSGKRINVDGLSPREAATELFGESNVRDAFAQARAAVKEGPVARFARRFTTLAPRDNVIRYADPNTGTQVERWAALGLPRELTSMVRNYWDSLNPGDVGKMKDTLDSLVLAVFDAAHLGDTADGQKFIDEWLERQKYAAGEGADYADPQNPNGPPRRLAFLPSQLADAYALPDVRKLLQFSKRNWLSAQLQAGMDWETIDRMMSNYWKPAMLLRPGFALRFAGEEILNFMVRHHGPLKWLQSLVAMSTEHALNAEKEGLVADLATHAGEYGLSADQVARINESDARALTKALTSHVPSEALAKLADKRDLLGSVYGWNTIRWMRRGLARTIAPEWLLDAAKNLADKGVYESAFGDQVDAVTGAHGNAYFGDPVKNARAAWIKDNSGRPLRITGTGEFKEYAPEDLDANAAWQYALNGLSRDPLAKAVMRAWKHGGTDAQVTAAEDWITGRDLQLRLAEAQRTNNAENIAKAEKALERRQATVRQFAVNFQTKDGRAVVDEATQRDALRDWATTIVDHVNHLTMTPEAQGAAKAGEEALLPSGLQPIQLKGPEVARVPFRLAGRDEGRDVLGADEQTAYLGIPEGNVRLFHGQNTTTAQDITRAAAPGRMWTPSYEHASNIAGEDGQVHYIDVPKRTLERKYGFQPRVSGAEAYDRRYSGRGNTLVNGEKMIQDVVDGKKLVIDGLHASLADRAREAGLAVIKHGEGEFTDYTVAKTLAVAKEMDDARLALNEALRASDGAETAAVAKARAEVWRLVGYNDVTARSYIDEIASAQKSGEGLKARGGPPPIRGTFESGDIVTARQADSQPRLLIDELADGRTPGYDDLEAVDKKFWPDKILAEAHMAKVPEGGALKGLVEKGMIQLVARPANWLSRRPIFGYNYAVAWREAKAQIALRGIEDTDGSLAHDVAMQRAFDQTTPYIHDPGTRSQFSLITRNLIPFWFAQEQFYKRWARVFGSYPEAWYKLSQTVNGMQHVGFVTKDAYGQDAFVYPGSAALLSMLQRFPFHAGLPISVGLQTELSNLNPTLTTQGAPIPSFGPVATVPMSLLGVMFPRWSGVAQAALGPNAPQLNEGGTGWDHVIEQFLPSVVSRLIDWNAAPKGADEYAQIGSPIYQSALIAAGAYLESHGYGLNAEQQRNPRLVQQYLDRLANWTKNLLLMRAFLGFLAPGTPNFKFNDGGLGNEFQALLNTMPYKDAVSAFVKAHPNALPETVFASTTSTKDESGTYVPASAKTGKYINDNLNFFEQYPQLSPWTIPAKDARGTFNGTIYQEEMNLNLRSRRTLEEWYDQVKYAEAADLYFPLDQAVKAAEAGTATPVQAAALLHAGYTGDTKTAIKMWWDDWKGSLESGQGFLGTHPIFAGMLDEPTASNRRSNVVAELRQAISQGALPAGEWGQLAAEMMVGFDQVQGYYDGTAGNSAYATQRKQNKDAYIAWGNQFAKSNPVISPFWNGVLSKEVPG